MTFWEFAAFSQKSASSYIHSYRFVKAEYTLSTFYVPFLAFLNFLSVIGRGHTGAETLKREKRKLQQRWSCCLQQPASVIFVEHKQE